MKNRLFIFTLAVCLCDCLLPFLLAVFYEGYNHKTMVLSSLGSKSSPVRYAFNIWMICLGVSLVFAGICIYRNNMSNAKISSAIFLAIIIIYAVADCIVSGFFAVGDSKEMVTTAQKIHGYGSVIGCTLFVFAGLACFFMLRSKNRMAAWISMVSFMLALATFTIFVAGENIPEDATGLKKVLSFEGLWQRVSFVFMYIPVIVASYIK